MRLPVATVGTAIKLCEIREGLGASRHFRRCVAQSPYPTGQVPETQETEAMITSHSTN